MAGMEISKLFASIGFKVDQRSLQRAERSIDQMANRMRAVTDTYSKANGPAKSYAKNINAIAQRYDKVGGSLQRVRSDFYSVNEQFRQGNITSQRRNTLLQQMVVEYNRLRAAKAKAAATPDGTERGSRGSHGIISALHSDTGLGIMAGGFAAYASSQSYQEFVGIQQGLSAATGSAEAGGREFEYLTKTSQQLGLALTDVSKGYTNFVAATKGTSLEGSETRTAFEAVSGYAKVLNLSADDTQGVFRA